MDTSPPSSSYLSIPVQQAVLDGRQREEAGHRASLVGPVLYRLVSWLTFRRKRRRSGSPSIRSELAGVVGADWR